MSRCLVTGVAGFIGSHLAEALLAKGHDVVGVDAFIPYYDRAVKEANLAGALAHDTFTFHELDLRTADLAAVVEGCDVIFNEAAMPGLMKSWSDLELYSTCNLLATQRVLDAARDAETSQIVHVSTSSVYGKEATGPEGSPTHPFSPYGVTKLAAEHLCRAYEVNFGVPVTILRYFSVYGPRQRPDMAYNILIRKLLQGETFTMFGDGEQTRSNTYVADCVAATVLAFENQAAALGQVFNIGGGEVVSLNRVIEMLEELTGRKARIERLDPRPGDQKHTAANYAQAQRVLGYQPTTRVRDGLRAQVEWQREFL
jgi:nucleoside-diphosphate-sugar epimerase